LKPSIFKIGIAITIAGIIWASVIFSDTQKTTQEFTLDTNHSRDMKLEFTSFGIGYYKIFIPKFSGDGVFVQILDSKNNIISEKMIETKMSVNYFDFDQGQHTVKVSNLSNEKISLEIEFGNTDAENMTFPAVTVLSGIIIVLASIYIKMKNYKIAQPDEKI